MRRSSSRALLRFSSVFKCEYHFCPIESGRDATSSNLLVVMPLLLGESVLFGERQGVTIRHTVDVFKMFLRFVATRASKQILIGIPTHQERMWLPSR